MGSRSNGSGRSASLPGRSGGKMSQAAAAAVLATLTPKQATTVSGFVEQIGRGRDPRDLSAGTANKETIRALENKGLIERQNLRQITTEISRNRSRVEYTYNIAWNVAKQ